MDFLRSYFSNIALKRWASRKHIAFLFFFALLATVGSGAFFFGRSMPGNAVVEEMNLMTNPSFETEDPKIAAQAYWGFTGASWDSSVAATGTRSARIDPPGPTYRQVTTRIFLDQWQASPLKLSFQSREEGATGVYNAFITAVYFDSSAEQSNFDLLANATSTPFSSDWRSHEVSVTPSKPVWFAYITVYTTGQGTIWLDDFRLTDGLSPAPYVPSPQKVEIDEGGVTTVNGEPFFPIGLYGVHPYWDYRNPEDADEIAAYGKFWFTPDRFEMRIADIAAHGFNTVLFGAGSSDMRQMQMRLDILQRYGMKAVLHMQTQYADGSYQLFELREVVERFRDHPAVLAWSLYDEPVEVSKFQFIRDAKDFMKSIDPDHPIMTATGEWPYEYPTLCASWISSINQCDATRTTEKALQEQATLGDVLAPDPYPIVGASNSGGIGDKIFRYIARGVEAIGSKQAVWAIVQAFPTPAFPSPEQLQAEAHQAVMAGAKGIFYFAYHASEAPPGETDWFLPSSAPQQWEAFKTINANTKILAGTVTVAKVPRSGVSRVVLKPGAEGIDAALLLGDPATNYGNQVSLQSGMWSHSYPHLGYRSLLKFDLSSIPPGKKINRALLRLHHVSASTAEDAFAAAYGVTGNWDEGTVTWNTQPSTDAAPTSVAEIGYGGTFYNSWYRWDVTKLASDWYAGTRQNYGVMMKDPAGELVPVADELAVVGESGNLIQVANPPTRYYYLPSVNPKVSRGWGAWVAGAGAVHHGSSTNYLSLESATLADNYRPGKFTLAPSLPPCTKIYFHYERSFNDVKAFTSSDDSGESSHWPELVVYYSDTAQADMSSYTLMDNTNEVTSALLGLSGGQPIVAAAETANKSQAPQFRIFGMGNGKATVYGTGRDIEIIDGVFRDYFGPSESKTYLITPGASVTAVSATMASTTLNLAPAKSSHPKAPSTPNASIRDPLTGTSLNLVWEKPDSLKSILCYLLYQSGKEDAYLKHPVIIPKEVTSYTVGNLIPGVDTYFRLTAVDVDGNESAATPALKGIPTVARTIGDDATDGLPNEEGITRPPSDGGLTVPSEGITLPGELTTPPPPEPPVKFGELFRIHMEGVREADQRDAVFYLGSDGKRYLFPHHKIFETWFPEPEKVTVKDVSLDAIKEYPVGGSVNYRPGVRMVKLPSDPKTYAVAPGGELRWVMNEQIAAAIYGSDWNKKIDDISEVLFAQYKIGKSISDPEEYKPEIAKEFTPTIEADKGVEPPPKVVESYDVAADDIGLYPSSITVRKGVTVRLTFKVRPRGVYYGGREFRSDYFTTTLVAPGGEITVEFLADQSFTYTSHRPGEEPYPAVGAVVVK